MRHFALRRRAVFLRRDAQRRPLPVQRVHRPGCVLRRKPLPRRIAAVLQSEPFQKVTGRKVEDIEPCRHCAIRHFCGSPCPAEAHEMNGGMDKHWRILRVLRRAGPLCLPRDRRRAAGRLPLGRLGPGNAADVRHELIPGRLLCRRSHIAAAPPQPAKPRWCDVNVGRF